MPGPSPVTPLQRRLALILVVVLSSPLAVWAHPGHGTGDSDAATHYVTEPVHALPIGLVLSIIVAAIALTALAMTRRSQQRCVEVIDSQKRDFR